MFHIGCLVEGAPGPRYVTGLAFAEIALREPVPRAATLRRWRRDMPDAFVCALIAPDSAIRSERGPLRFDAKLEEGFGHMLEAADALSARAIVLQTPTDLTTGQRDRDLLSEYVARIPRSPERIVVWAPGGLWDPATARRFADRLEIVSAVDPLDDEGLASALAGSEVLYARVSSVGARSRLSEPMLMRIRDAAIASGAEEAFVAFDSARAFRYATRVRELIASAADDLGAEP